MSGSVRYPDLEHGVALVTGAASGIGAVLAESFLGQGMAVAVFDRDAEAGKTRVDAWRHHGARVHFEAVDLRDVAATRDAVARVESELGAVRVLVHNAADDTRHAFAEVTPEQWDACMQTNLRHHFFVTQAVAPGMAAAGGGSVIHLGSITWKLGQAMMPVYTTAKCAISGMVRALARELGPQGIRVNAVLPGAILTEKQRRLHLTPEFEAEVLAGQCLPRLLVPEDVAALVLFLASDQASGCTGQDFIVDGGWS